MKIVTYNINGIRASAKLGLVDWIADFDADVYCIQEVRCDEGTARGLIFPSANQISFFDASEEKCALSNYNAVFNCGSKAGYAGTLVLCKRKPDKVLFDMGEFWKDDEGRTTTVIFGDVAIIDAYIPNGNSRLDFKMQYLEALTKFVASLKEKYHVVCVGDYNIAHNEIDLTNPRECKNKSVFLPIEREAFDKILNVGMIDCFRFCNPEKVEYSWRSYRSRYDTSYNSWKYRIDYILASDGLESRIKGCDILDLDYSDHLPVVAEIEE